MHTHETQYDLCLEHLSALSGNVVQLEMALRAYRDSDHHVEMLDSPFMLEMNEALIELNTKIERLIQRIDPSFSGGYVEGG